MGVHAVSTPRPTKSALALVALLFAGCGGGDRGATSEASGATELQTHSLFGEPLYALPDTTGEIEAADQALAAAPDNVELIIQAGRVRRNYWRYREAQELYTRAIELASDDWRPYRFRGHRHISLRDFDAAVRDLEAARERAPLNWDVSYHLGLAYFLAGRFDDAADEYMRCLTMADDESTRAAHSDAFRSCSQNADDPESRVAMTEWAIRASMRAGRDEAVQALVDGIPEDLPVEENVAYYQDLLLYKGVVEEEELLNPPPDASYRLETVGFGVANRMIAQGRIQEAEVVLEQLVEDPWWPGFGRIAAEVELARLRN